VRRREAFTLVEIAIAVFILLLLLMLAVPSLTGVLADRRLRRSLDAVNNLVRQAQERSVGEHRAYLIVWGKGSVALRPEALAKGETAVTQLPMQRGDAFTLTLPAALVKNAPAEWIFWPSGTCEPAVVEYKGNDGRWKAIFSPLTARPELASYGTR